MRCLGYRVGMVDANVFFKPDFALVVSSTQFALYREGSRVYTIIERQGGGMTLEECSGVIPRGQECYGLLGISQLQTTKCLLAVTEASLIGTLKQACLFRIERCEFLPFSSASSLTASDTHMISLLQSVINTRSFYFSYTYDLTHSLQRISSFSPDQKSLHRVQRADPRFFWNLNLTQELIRNGIFDPILPVISGFIQSECAQFGGHEIEYTVISRRDHRRAGVRFTTRGLDIDGNAANFVETEQILTLHQNNRFIVASYVQIRGSIPMLWQQKPDLQWAPKAVLCANNRENVATAEKHLSELLSLYSEIAIINLIDKKGNQKAIGTALQNALEIIKNPKIHYTWFDFHHECRAMKWENLSHLVREEEQLVGKFGFFECFLEQNQDWGEETVVSRQNGVLRTNCMDCLDRTNVVQSVFARYILHKQLHRLSISSRPTGEAFQPLPDPLEFCFRNFWANNADVISQLYAGTGALKVDFTRTGKRTKLGAIDDGRNSIHRYVINNFYDGGRKDAIDAFLGRLPKRYGPRRRHAALVRVIVVMVVGVTMAHIAGTATGQSWIAYCLGLGLGCLMLHKVLTVNGRSFVDRPFLDT